MELTDRQKVAHLLRRFSFGASAIEMQRYEGLSPEQVADKLINFGKSQDVAHPFQFVFKPNKQEAEPGGYRFRLHWILQMLVSETPLREKLALFWHDHFAVNEEDVGHGISMHDYMVLLRKDPAGKFKDTLVRMTRSTAVMRQLNVVMLLKKRPNENFARELLELYTLGEGNYTEQDIKQISVALSGWAHIDLFWSYGKTNDERLRAMLVTESQSLFSIYAPDAHVDGKKKVLGKEVESADDVYDLLAAHPQTAKFICTKLWEFFGYAKPEKTVVERLAGKFRATDGDIAAVLMEMTKMPEFWSEKCVRRLVKNPVDYIVGICRAQGVRDKLLTMVEPGAKPDSPVKQEVVDQTGAVAYYLTETGMNLFFPPNVAGWDWGEGWINTNNLLRRQQFTGILTYYPKQENGKTEWYPGVPTLNVVNEIKKRQPQTPEGIVGALCMVYDVTLSPQQQEVVVQAVNKLGGVAALQNDRALAWMSTVCLKLLGSAPEFHMC